MDAENTNFKNLIIGNRKYTGDDAPLSCLIELVDELIEDTSGLYWVVNNQIKMNPYTHLCCLAERVYPKGFIIHFLINDYSSWSPGKEFTFFKKEFGLKNKDFEEISILAYYFFKAIVPNHAKYKEYFNEDLDKADAMPFEERMCFNTAFLLSFATLSLPFPFILVNPNKYISKSRYDKFLYLVNGINNFGNHIYLIHIGAADMVVKDKTKNESDPSNSIFSDCLINNQNAENNSNAVKDSSSINNKSDADNDYPDDLILLNKGESEQFSGKVVIGEDLEPGRYNIALPDPEGNENVAFQFYDNEKAYEEEDDEYYWLFPKDGEHKADELINFK